MTTFVRRARVELRRGVQPNHRYWNRWILEILSRNFRIPYFCLVLGLIHLFVSKSWLETTSYSVVSAPTGQAGLDAIVTIAMCGFHAKRLVKSLREVGKWEGPIYVITDTPRDEDSNLCTPIDVGGNHPVFSSEQEFHIYKKGIQQFGRELFSKWHKTQIFYLLPESVNTVFFLDADIFACRPLDSWLLELSHMIQSPECELTLFPERWYTSLPLIGKNNVELSGKYNSGTMLLKRKESKAVLERWSDLLIRPPFVGRDQGKLTKAIGALETKLCNLPSRWKHVQNQADFVDGLWFPIAMGGKGTFLHLSSAKNRKKLRGEWFQGTDSSSSRCNFGNMTYNPP